MYFCAAIGARLETHPGRTGGACYDDDDPHGVIVEHVVKLRDILARLDAASTVADMDLPGFRLHPLKGEFRGLWAVTVRANWRVMFRFAERDVLDVDYVDYH